MTWGDKSVPPQWVLAIDPPGELIDEIVSEIDHSRIIVKILINRKIDSPEKVKSFIDGKTIRKVIVVPKKLVNIVAN